MSMKLQWNFHSAAQELCGIQSPCHRTEFQLAVEYVEGLDVYTLCYCINLKYAMSTALVSFLCFNLVEISHSYRNSHRS